MGLVGDAVEVVVESNRLFVFATGVLRVLFLLFGVTHWGACAWYIVGSEVPEDGDEDSWVNHYINDVQSLGVRYTYALYFTLTTMTTVGYGDIAAQNLTEVKFVLVLLLFASIIFAGLMGALTDLISNLNNDSNERSGRKVMLSRYMRWRAVPRTLFMSVREHLIFLWETNEFDEYEGFIKEQLPPTLKKELSYHIYGRILRRAPFFSWMRGCEVVLKDLAQHVSSLFLSKGDYLFHVGMPNEHIYVLLKGTLYISQNDRLDDMKTNLVDEAQKEEEHISTGFTIPRNKEASAVDVIQMLVGSIAHHRKQSNDEEKMEKVKDLLKGNTLDLASEEDEDEEALIDAKKDILESHVDSRLLDAAYSKLVRQDNRRFKAARYIQRRWKRKQKRRAMEAETKEEAPKRLSAARSKYVHAPAYLGESCLWQPLHEWESGPSHPYPYAARCESRGEFVYLSRGAVKGIIDRFSPWLEQRFEYFRQSVLDNIKKVEEGRQVSGETPAASPDVVHDAKARSNGETPASASKPSTRNNYDMAAQDLPPLEVPPVPPSLLTVPPGMEEAAVMSQSANQGKQYLDYNAMYYAGQAPMRSPRGVSALGLVLHNRATAPTRSFRAAAAAAVARVSQHVTPPSIPPTPAGTPRDPPGSSRRPGSSTRGTPVQAGVAEESRTHGSSLQEPLLPQWR